ncbi:response regulator [Paenibacillus sp. sgz302251]|uniref:response regulator n=1 Tax=Paenibacillus sp. sgz302251 TaxID=3414493 RepID=UPI003C7CD7D2
MFKVMIVDDERIVRKGIMTSINWSAYGIEIAAEAKNGQDALEKLKQCPVDLVLTDIRMPIMNGIELARSVRCKYPDIKLVLLSGYEDFQHAKEAMAIGIQHYLLKPVIAEKLVGILSGIRDEERSRRMMKQGEFIRNKLFNENLPHIKSMLMNSLINKQTDINEVIEKAKTLKISLEGPAYQIMIIEVDDYSLFKERLSRREREAGMFAILNIAEEVLVSRFHCFVSFGELGQLIGLINLPLGTNIIDICEELQLNLKRYLKLSVSIGLGQPVCLLTDVSRCYDQALSAIQEKAFYGKGAVIEFETEHAAPLPAASRSHLFREEEKQLAQCMLTLNVEGLRETIQRSFDRFRTEMTSFERIKSCAIGLIFTMAQVLEEIGIDSERIFPSPFLPHIAVEKFEVVADLEIWIKQITEQLIVLIEERAAGNCKKLVKEMMRYVSRNYDKPIGLSEAAEHVSMTPSYLSKVFKDEMGMTFTKWLNQLRVEEAKRLLKHTWLKTYEIAEKVGYHDYKYFSLVFKRHTGYSPRDYRNH